MDNFWDKVAEVHQVSCPICSREVSFERTGSRTYKTICCGHKECEQLIESLEEELICARKSLYRPFAMTNKSQIEVTITTQKKDDSE